MAPRRYILLLALLFVAVLIGGNLIIGLAGWSPWPEPPQPAPSQGVPARNLSTPMVIT